MDLILEMPEKVTSENIEDLITKEVEEQLEALDYEGFDDWLDEIGEPCNVGTLEYSQSQVLKNCDPTAYRVCFTDDYQESMRESIEQEVRDEFEAKLED
jgi:hypothetical protein